MESVDILLVEDNPDDQELTLRALRKHNLKNNIYVVQDGEEALEFLYCTGKYDDRKDMKDPKCILLDLKLPKKDGVEVLEEIKKDEVLKSIPVIMLTSSSEEEDLVKSYKLGVNSYIVKPVGFSDFIESVGQVGFYWLMLNKSKE